VLPFKDTQSINTSRTTSSASLCDQHSASVQGPLLILEDKLPVSPSEPVVDISAKRVNTTINFVLGNQYKLSSELLGTVLINACVERNEELAIDVINLGQTTKRSDGTSWICHPDFVSMSNISSVSDEGYTNPMIAKNMVEPITYMFYSTLMISCIYSLPVIALKIIDTNEFNPYFLDQDGNNVLMIACKFSLFEVADKLYKMYPTLLQHTNSNGESATSSSWVPQVSRLNGPPNLF